MKHCTYQQAHSKHILERDQNSMSILRVESNISLPEEENIEDHKKMGRMKECACGKKKYLDQKLRKRFEDSQFAQEVSPMVFPRQRFEEDQELSCIFSCCMKLTQETVKLNK